MWGRDGGGEKSENNEIPKIFPILLDFRLRRIKKGRAQKIKEKMKGRSFRGFVPSEARRRWGVSPPTLALQRDPSQISASGFSLKKVRILSKSARKNFISMESRPSGAFLCSNTPPAILPKSRKFWQIIHVVCYK